MNYKRLIFIFVIFLFASLSYAQLVSGDFRSNASGNWNATGTWYVYNGSTWAAATSTPTSTTNVYIQNGHTVTLTQAEACKDLHINVATGTKVALATYELSLNGKLRTFSGALNTLPGSNTTPGSVIPLTCSSSSGKLKVVGTSRNLTSSGQWGSGTYTATTSLFHIEINPNDGETITMLTNIRAQSWNIVSGTLSIGTLALEADTGTAGTGDITIGSNATVVNGSNGVNSLFRRSTSLKAGTLTIDGLLKIMTLSSYGSAKISMSAINLNGNVEYGANGDQYFLAAGSDTPAIPETYNNVILSGTGTKLLSLNITLNGTLTRVNTASLGLNTYSLTYGTSKTAEYTGTESVTTSASEFPGTNGPENIIIDNSGDVTIHDNSAVTGLLTFITGSIALANYSLTVDNPVSGTSSYIYNGSGYLAGNGIGTESNVILRQNTSTSIPDSLNTLTIDAGSDENISDLPDSTAVNEIVFSSGNLGFNSNLLTLRNKDFAITGPDAISALTVELSNTVNVFMGDTSIAHTWSTTGAFPNTVDIYLYYPDTMSSSSTMRAWSRNTGGSGDWTFVGTYASTHIAPMRLVIIPGVTSLNGTPTGALDWTLSEIDQELPVELTSFTAVLSQQTYVTLQWVTQSETNVIGYNIFRSNQNDLYTAVQVNANLLSGTNTSSEQTYYFRDVIVTNDNAYYYWLQDVSTNGTITFHGSITVELNNNGQITPPPSIPLVTSIKNVYPNPFIRTATINYGVEKHGLVNINVYNTKGQLVRNLVSDVKDANNYSTNWNGQDMNGRNCASGVYFIELRSGAIKSTIKAVIMK